MFVSWESNSKFVYMSFETEIRQGLFGTKYFAIDKDGIIWDDTQMLHTEITGFSYGSTETKVNGIRANTEFYFKFVDSSNDEFEINFYEALLGSNKPIHVNDQIVHWLWVYLGNPFLLKMMQEIGNGKEVRIGECTLSKAGIHFIKKPLFWGAETTHQIPWENSFHEVEYGLLIIRSHIDRKVKIEMSLRNTINAWILCNMMVNIQENQDTIAVLTGKKRP
jgi:hypothetical protein